MIRTTRPHGETCGKRAFGDGKILILSPSIIASSAAKERSRRFSRDRAISAPDHVLENEIRRRKLESHFLRREHREFAGAFGRKQRGKGKNGREDGGGREGGKPVHV